MGKVHFRKKHKNLKMKKNGMKKESLIFGKFFYTEKISSTLRVILKKFYDAVFKSSSTEADSAICIALVIWRP